METAQSTQAPRISIIIPAYNTAGLIAECLDSVFSQTYQDFECIVVNDGSPDTPDLEKALAPYQSRIVYIRQENKRAAGARNTAIQHARGEFLAFLDSDDSWFSNHLASQMELLDKDPGLDMVYSNAELLGDPTRRREFMDQCPSQGEVDFGALIVERCQVAVSTVVVRKRAIVKAGLFDESLARCDDYDLWLRTAFHGAKMGYSRQVQARLNGGRPGSLGQSNAKMTEAYWMILEKALRTLPLNDSDRNLVRERAAEIKARYLFEQGKLQLDQRQFNKARELFSEANRQLRRPRVSLALLGLKIAPNTTGRLISVWHRVRLRISA
jgi:glycosyltransferase involved in cell wall biosynthesis